MEHMLNKLMSEVKHARDVERKRFSSRSDEERAKALGAMDALEFVYSQLLSIGYHIAQYQRRGL
jgi:hypothetical protein